MKILMWIALYFVIGIVITIAVSKRLRNDRGYSIRNFDDLKSEERSVLTVAILLWPIAILVAIFQLILDIITKITNRKDGS